MDKLTSATVEDLIAYAWYRIGYRPRDSVVLVGLYRGPNGSSRCGVVLRSDLPPRAAQPDALDDLMRTIARTGHLGVLALVDARDTGSARRPAGAGPTNRRGLARAVRAAGRRADLLVMDVVGVGATHFRSYRCTGCCPPEGLPIERALTSRAAAALVLQGDRLADDEDDLVADVAPAPSPLVDARLLAARPPTTPEQGLATWRRLVLAAGSGKQAPAEDLADLCQALDQVLLRDAVLAAVAGPVGHDGLDLARRVLDGDGPAAFRRLDDGVPQDGSVHPARTVLTAVARHVPPGRRAESLAVLAWLEWWRGRGAAGRLYAERALADVPGHRLAHLVLQLLAAGIPPTWVGARGAPSFTGR